MLSLAGLRSSPGSATSSMCDFSCYVHRMGLTIVLTSSGGYGNLMT